MYHGWIKVWGQYKYSISFYFLLLFSKDTLKGDSKDIDNATKSISNKINVVFYWSKDPEKGV